MEQNTQKFAGFALGVILLFIVIYSICHSINFYALIAAIVFTILTILANPKIDEKLLTTPVLTYYSIFLSITLFFSIDDYKNNDAMMLLLVVNILVCVGVFFGGGLPVSYLFIFTNFYVVTRIFLFFSSSPEKTAVDAQFYKNKLKCLP